MKFAKNREILEVSGRFGGKSADFGGGEGEICWILEESGRNICLAWFWPSSHDLFWQVQWDK